MNGGGFCSFLLTSHGPFTAKEFVFMLNSRNISVTCSLLGRGAACQNSSSFHQKEKVALEPGSSSPHPVKRGGEILFVVVQKEPGAGGGV